MTAGSAGPGRRSVELDLRRLAGVVFDMDGVMTDTARVHAAAWKRMFDAFLGSWPRGVGECTRPFDDADYLRYVDGKRRIDGVDSFLRSRHIMIPKGSPADDADRDTVWGLANRKNVDFLQVLHTEGALAFPSSVSLVRRLQQSGAGTAVISASRNCREVLDAAGIGTLFAVRVDGIELERLGLPGKPEPDIFIEAARRFEAPPERAAIVEDAITGIEAGKRGNFAFVLGIDRHGDGGDLLAAGADAVVSDLAEVGVVS
jgi:alpha,alpha-trehalase